MSDFEDDHTLDPDKRFIEIPSQSLPYTVRPLPNPMTPMGTIDARGHLYQSAVAGRGPWWVIIASWPIIGLPGLGFLGFAIAQIIHDLKQVMIGNMPLSMFAVTTIMWLLIALLSSALICIPVRGTLAKLKRRSRQLRR